MEYNGNWMLFYQQIFKIIHCKNSLISPNAVKFVIWEMMKIISDVFQEKFIGKFPLSTELFASVGEVVIFLVMKKQFIHWQEKK